MTEGSAAPPPTVPRPWRRVLVAAAVAWGLLLALLGYRSAADGPATVREQRPVAAAAPTVDRATVEVARAAAAAGAPFVLDPARLRSCDLTPLRPGAALDRELTVVAPGGDAAALLAALRRALPAGYGASLGRSADGPRLAADAGDFVALTAAASGPAIAVLISTGCRPASPGWTPAPPADGSADAAIPGLAGWLAGGDPVRVLVRLPDGRAASSVTVEGAPLPSGDGLAARLGRPLPGTPQRWVRGAGGAALLWERSGDRLRVTHSGYEPPAAS
ncbi:hypothetical protein GCM10010123_21410 [Pilimelia anulata]|uniref:Uncharacterized protein n=1 Tax=Pilimelia anulata TaxID=53371 RepID=A0A8J3FA84_9ACTN|nr:hypothetical protein [Pilimelia anulata]GGJ91316.1 hypothetical protein GCM10010123_21410 [Pilimelia anulata]